MLTVGGVVSVVQCLVALTPVFPAGSVARTVNVCAPLVTPNWSPEEHAAYGAPSREHEKPSTGSSASNENDGLVWFVVEPSAGPPVTDTPGGVRSTAQL